MRQATVTRATKETDISVTVSLDGGEVSVGTGIGFFDHMLTAFGVHSGFGLRVEARGDLEVGAHHTVEDVGIVLGAAVRKALGDGSGVARYGSFFVPMDESLGFASLDISGRPFLVFNADFREEKIGDFDTCLCEEFFRAFAVNAGITLHLSCPYGANAHHMIEALFKAAAHAMGAAAAPTGGGVLSTKGVL